MGHLTPARLALIALCLLLLAGNPPTALYAAENEAIEAEDATFDALFGAMAAGADEAAMIDNQIETLKQTLISQSPEVSALESARPGLIEAFGKAMRPLIFEHSHRVQALYRPRFITILQEELSPEEAGRLLAFYTSPVGIKLLQNVSRNFTGGNVLADLDDFEQRVDAREVEQDVHSAAMKGLLAMSREDFASEDAAAMRDPDLMAKMDRVSARFIELRAEMENAPIDEDLGKAIEVDVTAAINAHLAEDADQPTE